MSINETPGTAEQSSRTPLLKRPVWITIVVTAALLLVAAAVGAVQIAHEREVNESRANVQAAQTDCYDAQARHDVAVHEQAQRLHAAQSRAVDDVDLTAYTEAFSADVSCDGDASGDLEENAALIARLRDAAETYADATPAVVASVDGIEAAINKAIAERLTGEAAEAVELLNVAVDEAETLLDDVNDDVVDPDTVSALNDALGEAAGITVDAHSPAALRAVHQDAQAALHRVDEALKALEESHSQWQEEAASGGAGDSVATSTGPESDGHKGTSGGSTSSGTSSNSSSSGDSSSAKTPSKKPSESAETSTPAKTETPASKPAPKPGKITWTACDGLAQYELKDGERTGSNRGCAIASDIRASIADNPGSGTCAYYGEQTSDSRNSLIAYASAFNYVKFEVAQADERQVTVKAFTCLKP